MKSLAEYMDESRKDVCTYKGKTVTYNIEAMGREWDDFADEKDLEQEHDFDKYTFDYKKNELLVMHEAEDNFSMRMLPFRFGLRGTTFEKLHKAGKELKPNMMVPVSAGSAAGEDSEIDNTLKMIACWIFNNSPEPLF